MKLKISPSTPWIDPLYLPYTPKGVEALAKCGAGFWCRVGGLFFPCFPSPFRKDQETYGSGVTTRILTSLLARSVLVVAPWFYVLMYPETSDW
ncbi:hypothetical protein [Sulfitobacter brevis]|uniref:hypothetical protein n=1 Tax=Sulfitobacter brevis TaxID=74348 RepID=UPI0011605505|nr:hypothetical protein [Sulfitobacter brevis]